MHFQCCLESLPCGSPGSQAPGFGWGLAKSLSRFSLRVWIELPGLPEDARLEPFLEISLGSPTPAEFTFPVDLSGWCPRQGILGGEAVSLDVASPGWERGVTQVGWEQRAVGSPRPGPGARGQCPLFPALAVPPLLVFTNCHACLSILRCRELF